MTFWEEQYERNFERRCELAGHIGQMQAYIGQAMAALANDDRKFANWCLEQASKVGA